MQEEMTMMEACVEYDFPEVTIPEMPEKRCYTVEDLQNILMCGRSTVYDLLKKNEFRYIKLGGSGYRISRKSFDEWLDKQS
jgi:excisionase family DNA binding protein